jgi:hypothetical protein
MLRFSDRAYLVGGDGSVVLLLHTDAAGAVQFGQRLLVKARGCGRSRRSFSAGAAAPGVARIGTN